MDTSLNTEQIRTLLADRLAEYEAFKYMDEILAKVHESERDVRDAKKALAKLQQDILGKETHLAELDKKASARAESLKSEYATLEADLQAKVDALQNEHDRKSAGLKEYQAQLKRIDDEHAKSLAVWQDRTQQVRSEHADAHAKLLAVQQQLDALAAMVGGKR